MTKPQNSQPSLQLRSTPLIAGAALIGVGGTFVLTGFALTAAAFVQAARRWMEQSEVPPSALAKQKWAQAKAATSASAKAWRDASTAGAV
jgi:hypothetical protein